MSSFRRRLALGVCALAAATIWGAAAPASAAPTEIFKLQDPRLEEISGIAAGITNPGVFYVANDSGDTARFFALDARTGAVRGVYAVPGARNIDWEDIAVGKDARGVPSVWLADIGDNTAARQEIQVYRVDEPAPGATAVAPAQVWRLRYPNGAVDAESLFIGPDGTPYLATNTEGSATVYALPRTPGPAVQTLAPVVTIPLDPFAVATAADLADGVLAIRTYTEAYLWRVRGTDIAATLKAKPVRVLLPVQAQGEALAVDRSRVVAVSERVGQSVYAVPIPAALAAPTSPAATTSAVPSTPPSTSVSSSPAVAEKRDTDGVRWQVAAAIAAAGAGVALLLVPFVRRRRGARADVD